MIFVFLRNINQYQRTYAQLSVVFVTSFRILGHGLHQLTRQITVWKYHGRSQWNQSLKITQGHHPIFMPIPVVTIVDKYRALWPSQAVAYSSILFSLYMSQYNRTSMNIYYSIFVLVNVLWSATIVANLMLKLLHHPAPLGRTSCEILNFANAVRTREQRPSVMFVLYHVSVSRFHF